MSLARKYATLVELRRRRDEGGDPFGGGTLRALAAEFPGCLRELDTLGLPELERRAAVTASKGDEPWVAWIGAYHSLMRAALAVRSAPPDANLISIATAAAGFSIDESFVSSIQSPPQGRMSVVIFRVLASRFKVPAIEISSALFPLRRPSPYHL
ncbi:MAG TPA: hypothetical protein VHJ20_14755 [Polyangia bacterium]|nr:hypothetical protein [Polyangia bacterium]